MLNMVAGLAWFLLASVVAGATIGWLWYKFKLPMYGSAFGRLSSSMLLGFVVAAASSMLLQHGPWHLLEIIVGCTVGTIAKLFVYELFRDDDWWKRWKKRLKKLSEAALKKLASLAPPTPLPAPAPTK